MQSEPTLSRAEIDEMVSLVEPSYRVREATAVDKGHSAVYHVQVATPGGQRQCVLKAVADEDHRGIATEARLLTLLAEHTTIPVPGVVGVVDEHDDVPAPFFLMEAMPGTQHQFEETSALTDRQVERLACQTGAYLGQLHALDAVDSFGVVSHSFETTCHGGRPPADLDQLQVSEGHDSWPPFLWEMVERELGQHASTQFADLTLALRSWFDERVDAVSGTASPVIGRIDHGVHNLLIDADTGDIESMLDWEFALAVTPGYDLQCVEYVLSGAVLSPIPGRPDRRELVCAAMVEGYDSVTGTPTGALSEYREHHALFELLAVVRSMNHLDSGLAKVPAAHEAAVAEGLRAEAETFLHPDEQTQS